MIILRIKKTELDAIISGTKKSEWRQPSLYNKRLLLKKNEKGLFIENTDEKEIKLINGYQKNSPFVIVKTNLIRPVKFTKDIEIKSDNFKAREGECAIEIKIIAVLKK